MAISKISRSSVSSEVYDQIRNNILNGEWKEGAKLPSENDLSELLGVSRISVRNAVRKLVGEGILISKHGGGTFVSDLSVETFFNSMVPLLTVKKEQILDMYEFRKILEVGNARLAVEHATEEDIQALEDNYALMVESSSDIEKFVDIDIEFHNLLAKSTKNVVSYNMHNILKKALLPYQTFVQKTFGTKGGLKYHKIILQYIKERDVENATKFMGEHMEMTIKNIRTSRQNID